MAKQNKEIREDEPIVMALGLDRIKDGWTVTTYRIQGDKVVSREQTNVDVKAIAVESFKLKAVKELMSK